MLLWNLETNESIDLLWLFFSPRLYHDSSCPRLGLNYSPYSQSGVMRPSVSQCCIGTELISVFAIRGAYCPKNSQLSLVHYH